MEEIPVLGCYAQYDAVSPRELPEAMHSGIIIDGFGQ